MQLQHLRLECVCILYNFEQHIAEYRPRGYSWGKREKMAAAPHQLETMFMIAAAFDEQHDSQTIWSPDDNPDDNLQTYIGQQSNQLARDRPGNNHFTCG